MLGNHRDAWVFGAIDPSSGTATLLEVARAFGEMVKGGWRPRRTLMFCSWGAEEYGLIGSTEWVEVNPNLPGNSLNQILFVLIYDVVKIAQKKKRNQIRAMSKL